MRGGKCILLLKDVQRTYEMVFPETLSIWSLFEDTQMGTDAHALLDMHNT